MNYHLKSLSGALMVALLFSTGTAQACNSTILTIKDWSIVAAGAKTARLATIIQSNVAQKITLMNASIVFEDAAGDMLFSSYIDRGLTLAPHDTHGFQASIMEMETLYHLRKQAVKASVCLRSLKYSDGRIVNFD
ncbi:MULTISPECIES: hypothetical protein [Ochrobactrum]|uniref:Uncharacterized protein n=1 Tax=Ochrobactrum quorumnocens TaxID=271865 RepID=A0A5N1JQN1_9HYPH|nr:MULTISPECIES: hypothetical protein [Brucella/Ochrobactrum group]KAA9356143.1 hypothetical protein F3W84_21805 [[Ochrobactrum] quorumnocens]MBD7993239.1 hypothetical protein [Ochrobactrum gallinarum]MDH7793650.1 hypothetical protein [Ochrobactrum sp. AN78]